MKEYLGVAAAAAAVAVSLTFGTLTANAHAGGMVSLTFDDGWKSQYESVVPLLHNAGMKGTFYVISGFVGEDEYMDAEEVADLSARGHEVGAHSVSHPHLPDLGSDEVTEELVDSKAYLEEVTGKEVTSFAYPYGEYYEGVDGQTADAGYATARTADDGFNDEDTGAYLLRAYTVEADTPIALVKDLIDEAKADGTWLIISFHHIDDSGRQYSIPTEYVEEVIAYLNETSVPEVTVSEGYELLHGAEVPDDTGTSTPPVDDGEGTSTPPTDDDTSTSTPPTDDDDDQGGSGDDDQGENGNDDDEDDDMESHGHHFSIENYRAEVRARINELRGRFR